MLTNLPLCFGLFSFVLKVIFSCVVYQIVREQPFFHGGKAGVPQDILRFPPWEKKVGS